MITLTAKFYGLKRACISISYIKIFKRNCMKDNTEPIIKKDIHPYKQIHPWKSLLEFAEDLLTNMIYNKDGLVALNKPYGIRRGNFSVLDTSFNVPNNVDYTIDDALPYICDRLNYENLTVVKYPATHMSGVTLLAANVNVENAVKLAYIHSHFFANTYWIIAVGIPRQLKGQYRLALRLTTNSQYESKKPTIITSWSKNDEKYRRIKLLKTEHNVISNSKLNLCSLIKIKSSTAKRYAVRLFASTFLYCPVLGDTICASQIQKVANTFVKVDPFLTQLAPPKLDNRLLDLLNVSPKDQNIIPAHIHLRSVVLPMFFGNTLVIEAPLSPYFEWTYRQLEFKPSLQNTSS